MSEIGFDLHHGMAGKLTSVVERYRLLQNVGKRFQKRVHGIRYAEGVFPEREKPCEGISGFSLHHREDRSLVVFSDDRIALPVSDDTPFLHFLRTIVDHLAVLDLVFSERLVLLSVPMPFPLPPEVCLHELRRTLVHGSVERVFRERLLPFPRPSSAGLFRRVPLSYPIEQPTLHLSSWPDSRSIGASLRTLFEADADYLVGRECFPRKFPE